MNPNDLASLTVYSDVLNILKERGYVDAEANQILLDLIAQAEMETTDELLSRLTDEQLAKLDELPDSMTPTEMAESLGLDGEEVDAIRAEKTARIISELAPVVDQGDEEVEPS